MIVAARCLGRLATPGGALTAELVEAEVKHALEWLTSERNENRRFAAVLILKELARNSSTLVYPYIPGILVSIWEGLRDQKVGIRETAAEGCRPMLQDTISTRPGATHTMSNTYV